MKIGMIIYFNVVCCNALIKSAKSCNVNVIQSLVLTNKNNLKAFRENEILFLKPPRQSFGYCPKKSKIATEYTYIDNSFPFIF